MGSKGFHDVAVDHATEPRNCGMLADFNGYAVITGPCGDTMEFWVLEKKGILEKVSFITDGCAPSIACGSMATELASGIKLSEVDTITQQKILDALVEIPEENEHCALLASNTLKAACKNLIDSKKLNAANGASVLDKMDGESEEVYQERVRLHNSLASIKNKIVVMSGKGGVGKSTVAVNLAASLVLSGKKVGLLDVDLHGPSIPTMLGIENSRVMSMEEVLFPIEVGGLKVMSIGLLLNSQDDAIIWRGPRKMSVIKQFLADVVWGGLDYLIIDVPPGTGDEHLTICQLIGKLEGAVVVTTPQKVSAIDVRKSITFCRQMDLPIIGIVENMSGFICPKCGEITHILNGGGAEEICEDFDIPYLGSIPIDPRVAEACDNGQVFINQYKNTIAASSMLEMVEEIDTILNKKETKKN